MEENIYEVLSRSVSKDYATALMGNEEFLDYVIDDIKLTSGYEDEGIYSDADIKYAIGRAICWKFGIEF